MGLNVHRDSEARSALRDMGLKAIVICPRAHVASALQRLERTNLGGCLGCIELLAERVKDFPGLDDSISTFAILR